MGKKEEIVFEVVDLPYPREYLEANDKDETEFRLFDLKSIFSTLEAQKADREYVGDKQYTKWKAEQYALSQKLHDGDFVYTGDFIPKDTPEAVKQVMAKYAALVEEALKIPGLSKGERNAITRRHFGSFAVYIELFSSNEFLISKHWTNADDPDRERFIAINKPTFSWYFQLLQEKNIKIASFFLRRLPALIPEEDRKRHTYICAQTGSGKSELLKILVYSYLRKPDYCSIVVIEPHGDLCEEIARFRENARPPIRPDYFNEAQREKINNSPAGQIFNFVSSLDLGDFNNRLVYIDPTLYDDFTPSINPFQLNDKSEKSIDVTSQQLKDVFEELLRGSSLSLQMETILIPCISVLLRMENATIKDLQIFMDDERNAQLVRIGTQSPNEAHREFFKNAFFAKSYSPTKQSIYTKIQSLLNSPGFASFIAKPSTIDLEAELEAKKLILFNLNKGKMGKDSSEAVGRFIVATIQGIILRRANIEKSARVPAHLFIDECQNYVSPKIEEFLTELRKFGLHLTLANQFIGQNMDTQFKNALLSSTSIKIMGMNNVGSLSVLAKETGADVEELQQLKVGEFFMKCGGRAPLKIYVPEFLMGNKNSMNPHLWNQTKALQKARYYQAKKTAPEATEGEQLSEDIQGGRTTAQRARTTDKKPKFDL